MLTFKQHLIEQELLNEKLLLINNGKKYGQIVFLAGGAGSGKGFAGSNFMNIQDYRVRDVDEMKLAYLKMNKLTHKYPELDGLNLKNPDDVFKLHTFVEKKGSIDATLKNMIKGMANPETLPNIVFDVTLKNIKKIDKTLPSLLEQGYKSENIHIVWVLTDYKVAAKANLERDRVVPAEVLLQTHEGAKDTMWGIVGKGNIPKNVNGGIYVILNNRDQTVVFKSTDGKDFRSAKDDENAPVRKTTGGKKYSTDKDVKGEKTIIIKDFTYLTYKEPGKAPKNEKAIHDQLLRWVVKNAPKTDMILK